MTNPILSKVGEMTAGYGKTATYAGVGVKSVGLVLLVMASAAATWVTGYATPITTTVTSIMAFVVAMIGCFKPSSASFIAPLYAILEGMCLACVSVMANAYLPGVVPGAVLLTMGIALAAAFLYSTGIVKVTPGFVKVVSIALIGIIIAYVVQAVMSLFGSSVNFMHPGGLLGIGIELIILCVASACLFMDYEQIRQSVDQGLPAESEWYCAFSLLITLVWLYIQIIDLIMTIQAYVNGDE